MRAILRILSGTLSLIVLGKKSVWKHSFPLHFLHFITSVLPRRALSLSFMFVDHHESYFSHHFDSRGFVDCIVGSRK